MANRQHLIDRLIREVHEGATPDHGEFRETESERCELVVEDGEPILILTDLPPLEWSPKFVSLIAHDLDEDRVEELMAGDELNEEETELWESEVSSLWDVTTTVHIYSVLHSGRPDLRAYVGWHTSSSGQMGDLLAWAGPFPHGEDLCEFAISQTREWLTIGHQFDPMDILEMDGIGAEDAPEGRWDEIDQTQADLIFQAVKAARTEQVRSRA